MPCFDDLIVELNGRRAFREYRVAAADSRVRTHGIKVDIVVVVVTLRCDCNIVGAPFKASNRRCCDAANRSSRFTDGLGRSLVSNNIET